MLTAALLILAGLVGLVAGGDVLVRGAVGLAGKARLSPLVIGVVVVGFGTSMPELVTSVESVLAGSPALAWGNIVGSNVANSLLILGGTALAAPILLGGRDTFRDPLTGAIAAGALLALAFAGMAHRMIGAAFLAAVAFYLILCLRRRHQKEADDLATQQETGSWWRPLAFTTGGLALLIGGGQVLVTNAIVLAGLLGLSETVIGLTVVAVGTSLPELVTAVVAARKGHPEVAFGNVAGSNIYNILLIGGTTMLLAPQPVPEDLLPLNLTVMTAAAIALLLFPLSRRRIGRMTGALMIAVYGNFLALQVAIA